MKNQPAGNPEKKPGGLAAFWAELKRRKVMRVAITYTVVAWLIIQVAATTFEGFGIPIWAFRFVRLCVILGFPIAIILAWAFELTPEGIKTTKKAQEATEAFKADVRKGNWFSVIFAAAVPTVIFGALALFFYVRSGGDEDSEAGEKSIAVLPLENMSPDPDNAFFADGVQEDILTNLSKIEELDKVISRTSTLQKLNRRPTNNQKAYDLFMRFRQLVDETPYRNDEKIELLEHVVDLDDQFAEAWAYLAIEYSSVDRMDEAEQSLGEAKRISPELPHIPYAESYLISAEIGATESITPLLEALAIEPNFFEARRRLALIYRSDGRLAEAQHHYEELIRTDPLSARVNKALHTTYTLRHLWEKAYDLANANLRSSDEQVVWHPRMYNMEYLRSGDLEAYVDSMEKVSGFIDAPTGKAWKALLLRDYTNAHLYLNELDSGADSEIYLRPNFNFTYGVLIFPFTW